MRSVTHIVVFDRDGEVAGYFQVPHVPTPKERAADESLRSEPNPAALQAVSEWIAERFGQVEAEQE